mgnify:CR=1 FL=1
MQAISVKDLRLKLPFVRSELKKGTTFLVIYKSQPIAKLTPVEKEQKFEEATDEEWEKAAMEDMCKSFGDDWPDEEEINYYLSLPPYEK